ncbi:MAG: hypothetical protein HQK77_10530 [Desulfobacterales bacterium]|nr:hypothetical protein [Desulfobacterales bacterium]
MTQNQSKIDLLESHVQFEMELFQHDGLKETIGTEITALFEWFKNVSLNDVTSASDIENFFKRNVIERPITDEIPNFVSKCAKKIQETLQKNTTHLEDILSKNLYDKIVLNIYKMDTLRNEIIKQAVNSTIFSMLITETLYSGIKSFVLSENAIMKNVPGASSLFNFGKGLLNKTTFGLSDSIAGHLDEEIKKFVKGNIKNHLKNSEKFLINEFSEDFTKQIGEEIWQKAKQYDSNSLSEFIDQGHIESMSPVIKNFWLNFRNTPIYSEISSTVIQYFFELYGDKKISDLLFELGISLEMVIKEVEDTAMPIFEKPIVRSYLEQRIRARLERFYTRT